MSTYTEKNKRRREFHQPGNPAHDLAREMRSSLSGSFGRLPDATYNRMVVGTSGTLRKKAGE